MKLKPYAKYKDSGVESLGDVPDHWTVKRLKRVCLFAYGDSLASENRSDGSVIVFGSNGPVGMNDKPNTLAPAIVIGRKGSFGKVTFSECPCFAIDTAYYVDERHSSSDLRWLFYLLQSLDLDEISQDTGVPGLSREFAYGISVPTPPHEEQVWQAQMLDRETTRIDTVISEQKDLIALLGEKRQAVISHAVTKGLNRDVPMKDSGVEWLGVLPEHWEVRRVKTISTFLTSGPRGWSERVGEEGHLFIQSGDLNDSLQVEFHSAKRVLVAHDAEAIRTRLNDGDVVVCITGAKTGNVAVCASVPEPAYVNQHLCLIRPSNVILPVFLGLLLKSKIGQTYFEFSQYGLKQGLSLEDVQEAPVFLPSVTEQASIVSFLQSAMAKIDKLIGEAESAILLLQEHRTALITAVVTGKVDVREAACV